MLPGLDKWLAYYRHNQNSADGIDWSIAHELSESDVKTIATSIAAFQLGESSEGRGLMKFARAYAKIHNDTALVEITRLFVKEEQKHAALLAQFMRRAGIPVIQRNWTDSVFRRLRKNIGFELSITVLITAEIIALTYYRALAASTNSILLRQICNKLLTDEKAHVCYEASLINYIRMNHGCIKGVVISCGHRLLFFGAVLAVAIDHHQVITNGGFNLSSYWKCCWADFNHAFREVSPEPPLVTAIRTKRSAAIQLVDVGIIEIKML